MLFVSTAAVCLLARVGVIFAENFAAVTYPPGARLALPLGCARSFKTAVLGSVTKPQDAGVGIQSTAPRDFTVGLLSGCSSKRGSSSLSLQTGINCSAGLTAQSAEYQAQ